MGGRSRSQAALLGIEALKKLVEPYSYGTQCWNIGSFLLDKHELETINKIEKNLKRRMQDLKETIEHGAKKLRPKGGKKYAVRQILLPYEKWLYELFLKNIKKCKKSEALEIVSDIFYGYGLEKRDSVSELRKTINKAPLPCKATFDF